MTVPSPEELTAAIAELAGVSPQRVSDVLAGQGVSLVPVPPAQRSLDLDRLSIRGAKVNTQWDGPFEKCFEFTDGVTALITDENLRGKSTILELITWALRGSPRHLRDDVKPWFDRIVLEYAVNGTPMAVVLTRGASGFEADILRADSREVLREFVDGRDDTGPVHIVASGLPAADFEVQQSQLMMTLLSLEPITNFQKHSGSDDGSPVVHAWPAYFGGLYLPEAGSEILFGDTVFASLPARILQMFCNVPLMSSQIRLATLAKQVKQDERHKERRLHEDAEARADERTSLVDSLADIEARLATLPSTSGRTYQLIAAELNAAELALATASDASRSGSQTLSEARAARQAEELRVNNLRETHLAHALFQGLMPKHCPRCEQGIEPERSELELSDHQCSVCARPILAPVADGGDSDGEAEDVGDALEALRDAEAAARLSAEDASAAEQLAASRVRELVDELSSARTSDEFTNDLALQLERARLAGRIESLPEAGGQLEKSESLAVLEAAAKVLTDVTRDSALAVFAELDSEILELGRKFGISNLESVELDRRGGMKVTTAGVESSFRALSGGERLRLRVAVVVALLRIGHRSGVGSHPGLIILDSPGSDELTVADEATLLLELDALKAELRNLQVVIASAEPAAVQGFIPEESVYSSLEGGPLW
jgi:hypothetical protein